MPAEVRRRFAETVTETRMRRGATESDWAMYYASILLQAQTWPETPATDWFTGRSTQENYDEAVSWLRHWAQTTARRGQIEFDSPTHLTHFVSATLLLYDFAKDREVQSLAANLTDLLLADYLSESLGGAYCGAHGRVLSRELFTTRYHPVANYHFMYAGGISMPPLISPWSAIAAYSWYQPPAPLRFIANDRAEPYVHREVKRGHDVLRHGSARNPVIYKYTYMTRFFGMGSTQGGLFSPFQQHSWGLTWRSKSFQSTMFSIHPYSSLRELAMFYPDDPRAMRPLLLDNSPYTSRHKILGGSPYEHLHQDKNTLLILYDFPTTEGNQEASLLLPKCLECKQSQGWIFGRDGDFHVAIYPCQAGKFEDVGSGVQRFRSKGATIGFVIIAESTDTVPPGLVKARGFEAFQTSVLGCQSPVVRRRSGVADMSFSHPQGGTLTVSSEARKAAEKPSLYDSRFMTSWWDSGKIQLSGGSKGHVIDLSPDR